MKKINIGIIGATGSVGKSTLSIISEFKQYFNVTFLVANSNYKLLSKYAKETNANNVIIIDKSKIDLLQQEVINLGIHKSCNVLAGSENLKNLIQQEEQVILVANNGIEALDYILQCILNNQTIMLANKEALVSAGDIINEHLKNSKAKIIPVDSEHNAIYQILSNNKSLKKDIEHIIITASGGPFYNYKNDELKHITKEQAIKHPNWNMGEIISVNSATLVNKALEIIEAHYLFNLESQKIKAVYHPQSLIHGIVKYKDGSLNMVAYKPNMQVSLAYALFPNERLDLPHLHISCCDLSGLILEEINVDKLKPINLAKDVLKVKGNAPCIFNVANEVAVNAFLLGKINFLSIINIIEHCLGKISYNIVNNITDVYRVASYTQKVALEYINSLK